jgi:hypothetical protein
MDPKCTHEDHSEFAFSGRCHIKMPTRAWYKDDVVSIYCGTCDDLIAEVSVTGDWGMVMATPPEDERGQPLHGCCDGQNVVSYIPAHGHLTIICSKCKSPLTMPIDVADGPPAQRRRMFFQGEAL